MKTFMYAGNTLKSKNEIESEGSARAFPSRSYSQAVSIVNQRPKYSLINNNCQNFAKYLIEAISMVHLDTQTLEDVISSLVDTASSSRVRLPGTYPESSASTGTSQEFSTAQSNFSSYETAEQTPFYTAASRLNTSKSSEPDGTSIITSSIMMQPIVEESYLEMEWTMW